MHSSCPTPASSMMMREAFPDMPIHLSVQANAVNWATVKFWHQMGLTRAILSASCPLDEIEEIRMQVPEMELEVFVHGRCAWPTRPLPALRLHQQARPQSGHLHQLLPLGVQGARGQGKMTWARSSTARSPSPCRRWIRPWAPASRPMPWCCWKSPTARASS